ncbi:hypothetical protein DFJ75_4959 [Williamsia muralis]|uniref:Helix-turn-helix protein n=1 Tax=Williamsia marianensis TaxID=85044 RepID=A0A495ISS7_WILMA|nr:hypothetical protein [Williamsia muralis]RKR79817.1 hypothetical protein DFJ75_4959 [Williamsia muralis]
MSASRLLELIDLWRVADQRTDAEAARRIGISRATLSLMRTNGVKALPNRSTLEGIAATISLPYTAVLVAALRDAGYLDHQFIMIPAEENQAKPT